MFRDLDGFIRKNQAQNGLKMSFFFLVFSSMFFPDFVPCMCFFLWITFFFFFFHYTVQHVGSQFLDQELNQWPIQWKHRVLTLDHQGSPMDHFVLNNFSSFFVFSALLFSLLLPLFFIPSFFYTPRPNQNEALQSPVLLGIFPLSNYSTFF